METNAEILTTTAAVRQLTPEEAEKQHPVRLSGIVIYYDSSPGHAVLHDETGSVFFRPGRSDSPDHVRLHAGEKIAIQGVTVRGNFSPSVAGMGSSPHIASRDDRVNPVKVLRLGTAALPKPTPVSFVQVFTESFHDQWIEVHGTIRKIDIFEFGDGKRIQLCLSGRLSDETIQVLVPYAKNPPEFQLNQPLTVRGVLASGRHVDGKFTLINILVPNDEHLFPKPITPSQANSDDSHDFNTLFRYQPANDSSSRQRRIVRGVITYIVPDKGAFLQSYKDQRGLWLKFPNTHEFSVGDQIEAFGFPARLSGRNFLDDAVVSYYKPEKHPVIPLRLNHEQVHADEFQYSWVELTGELIEVNQPAHGQFLFIQHQDERIPVRIKNSGTFKNPSIRPNAIVSVRGILSQEDNLAAVPRKIITLLARSTADVTLIRPPPFFTPQRLRTALAAALVLIAITLLIIVLLRWQVARQTSLIARQARHKTLTEERQRISRELHDTLEQQLAGVQIHLDAIEDWSENAPAPVKSAVSTARAMLDHTRGETRRNIFELRSPLLEQAGLSAALEHTLAQLRSPHGPTMEIHHHGTTPGFPRNTEFHLLRILQEILTNALKHASASDIHIHFHTHLQPPSIIVTDDGIGFDPEAPGTGSTPRFGLLGIRERLAKINGSMKIHSAPGKGTEITLVWNP